MNDLNVAEHLENQEWLYRQMPSGNFIVFETWDKPVAQVVDENFARLIAAAPELLKALKLMLTYSPRSLSQSFTHALMKACAAVDEAEGRNL